jgi:putative ABC transport system ATP-binding protein
VIALEGIQKIYGKGAMRVEALRGIDLRVAAGEFVAVCGPSGSGKSTLLHIMGLLDRPTAGRYLLNGSDVTGLSDVERSRLRNRTIGFVFQSFHLLPRLTALGNVMLPLLYAGRRDAGKAAREALAQVGLAGRERHRPGELSGGEQQRVAIARAIVKGPGIVLADEPTGNLDSRTGRQILDLLCEIHGRGVTLVIITHDAPVAERAGRVVHTEDGRLGGGGPDAPARRTREP